ncbi:hypothetical protein PMM47T1_24044 [Pseudomonas sp. M47T1]|nr:hypothetical protein PMM47T1_24044 [Pseudomonas sp. M47T1]
MADGFVVLGLSALLLLISLGAFILEYVAAYGLQDRGIAKHRRFFKVVGFCAGGAGTLGIIATTFWPG